MIHEEYHVTVRGDAVRWWSVCQGIGIKPLWIELNNFERQLMCATEKDPHVNWAGVTMLEHFVHRGFEIVRVKHEKQVPPNRRVEFVKSMPLVVFFDKAPEPPKPSLDHIIQPIYYECHLKFDGLFNPNLFMASRDLYRVDRWYVTKREPVPFDPATFQWHIEDLLRRYRWPAKCVEAEYEACVSDTNTELDARWVSVVE